MQYAAHLFSVILCIQVMHGTNQLSSSKPDECVICLDDIILNSVENRTITTTCNHVFHEACLNKWRSQINKPTCPLCRTSLAPIKPTEPSVVSKLFGLVCSCLVPVYE